MSEPSTTKTAPLEIARRKRLLDEFVAEVFWPCLTKNARRGKKIDDLPKTVEEALHKVSEEIDETLMAVFWEKRAERLGPCPDGHNVPAEMGDAAAELLRAWMIWRKECGEERARWYEGSGE